MKSTKAIDKNVFLKLLKNSANAGRISFVLNLRNSVKASEYIGKIIEMRSPKPTYASKTASLQFKDLLLEEVKASYKCLAEKVNSIDQ